MGGRQMPVLQKRCLAPLCLTLALVTQTGASAQNPPVEPGDIVRTATVDSASEGLWLTGTVVSFSRDSIRLSLGGVSPLVSLNESIRVQVKRGRRRKTAVGGAIGFLLGGAVGVLTMDNGAVTSQTESTGFGRVFTWGSLGALVGAVIGSRFGPTIWEEVPVGRRAMLAEAMPVTGLQAEDIVDVEWWTRLESEQVDVRAVLELNAGNLDPIEGVWNRLDESGVVAIARESRYDGIDYVAYAPSGRIIGAMNGTVAGSYQVRFPPGTRQFPAGLSEGILTLRSPGDTVRQWVKRSETVDSNFIALAHGVTLLSPVIVEASRVEQRLSDVGFISRAQALSGTFLTREDIVRQNPRNTAELLRRIPGFSVSSSGEVRAPRENLCGGVEYFVDGVHADGSHVAFVLPSAVAGMEVYTSAAAVPIQYQIAANPRCGVILIWTVDGGRTP